jgi:hypothetical protein
MHQKFLRRSEEKDVMLIRRTPSVSQSVPSSVLTPIIYDTILDDGIPPLGTCACVSIPDPGVWLIIAQLYPPNFATEQRVLSLYRNEDYRPFASSEIGAGNLTVTVEGLMFLRPGDIITAKYFHTNPDPAFLPTGVPGNWISLAKVG